MFSRVSSAELQQTLGSLHSLNESQWSIAKKSKDVTVWRRPSQEFSGFLYKAEGSVAENPQRIMDHIRPGACRLDWDSMITSLEILQTLDQGCCVVRYTTAGQLWNIISPREFVDFSCTSEYQRGLLSCGQSLSKHLICFLDQLFSSSEATGGPITTHLVTICCCELADLGPDHLRKPILRAGHTSYFLHLTSVRVSVEHDEQRAGLVRGCNHPCGWFCVPAQDSELSVLTGYIQTELRGMLPQPAVDTAMASGLLHFYSDLRRALNT
ncbi:stAR-related lipid transfer protein 4 isoform X1 [Sinocyclocheilus anshuiensis]|uniref:stAR-related lipid transfer protein 4 isoform X1 n=1 Tax=Sinocyclocheilus anshuiensis TaxID=1608454 RepID=UPI0007B99BC0|nr:PREDICTED: stAR-related lipid transfer protein 4 isoform X1 [Sinocyclocheilus anshuiensis]